MGFSLAGCPFQDYNVQDAKVSEKRFSLTFNGWSEIRYLLRFTFDLAESMKGESINGSGGKEA